MSDTAKSVIHDYALQKESISPDLAIKFYIDDIFKRINDSMSLYKENSEINKIKN